MCMVLGNHLSTSLTLPFEDGQGQQLPSFQLQGQVKELRTGSCLWPQLCVGSAGARADILSWDRAQSPHRLGLPLPLSHPQGLVPYQHVTPRP